MFKGIDAEAHRGRLDEVGRGADVRNGRNASFTTRSTGVDIRFWL